MGYKFRLRDVQTRPTATGEPMVYIATPEFAVNASAIGNENARGDRWFDCLVTIQTEPQKEGKTTRFLRYRHLDHFELTGPPSKVARMIARECRDVANETANRLFGDA